MSITRQWITRQWTTRQLLKHTRYLLAGKHDTFNGLDIILLSYRPALLPYRPALVT